MALPEVNALSDRIEQLTIISDPAERDSALASIESDLRTMLSFVSTYRGDAQAQLRGRREDGSQET